jgi:zinc transport system substrate-binding protein
LKPSDAEKLQQAQVIFWIGHELEAFLEKPIQSLAQNATALALIETPGIKKLAVRESEHEEGHDHDEHSVDAHIWLDPENAIVMLNEIEAALSKADPANAPNYAENASRAAMQLQDISKQIATALEHTRSKEFIVFHDAYQYFEARYNLKSSAAISIHPENPPGAKQIAAIRKTIIDRKVQCVFAEPQFDNKLISVVLEGTSAKTATLDPIGADLAKGPELYVELLLKLTNNFSDCMR